MIIIREEIYTEIIINLWGKIFFFPSYLDYLLFSLDSNAQGRTGNSVTCDNGTRAK